MLGSLKIALFSSLAAYAVFVLSPATRRSLERVRHPVVRLAFFLLVMMVLSVPTSLWQGKSFNFILDDHLKTLVLMLLVIASVRSFADVERYLAAHILGAAIYSAYAVFLLQVGEGGRLGSLFYYDANDLGLLLVCTLPFLLYFSRRGVRLALRLAAIPIAALLVMAIVKTGSRGAFLGLIGVALFALLAFRAAPVRARVGWVIGGILALSMIASDQYWTQMQTILNPKDDYNWSGKAEGGRMEIWKRGVGYMMDRPLTGVGVQAFQTAEGTISPLAARQSAGKGLKWSAAHNSFVQIGAELGVPGLLFFVAMLVTAFRSMGSLARSGFRDTQGRKDEAAMAQALRASLVGYVISGFFLSQGYAVFLYALLGLIVALSAIAQVKAGAAVPRWSSSWFPRAVQRRAG